MNKQAFEQLLEDCCKVLQKELKASGIHSPLAFENRVRQVLDEIGPFHIDFTSPAQAFPDIVMDEYGVEVKFTLNDTWRCVANSILERQRVEAVNYIYVIFGKMGGVPSVRWQRWEDAVVHVRTSHVPRFELDFGMESAGKKREPLFQQMGISYNDFRVLDMPVKMRYVRAYARRVHPAEYLWWVEDNNGDVHTTGQARLYTSLTLEEKSRYRAEAALLCPEIVKTGRSRNKYDRMVIFLLTYYGIVCHQARDLFSAGSVGNPQKKEGISNYIEASLSLLEPQMRDAASQLDDRLFQEYWGESCAPDNRIARWLEKADALATTWKPSASLFRMKV